MTFGKIQTTEDTEECTRRPRREEVRSPPSRGAAAGKSGVRSQKPGVRSQKREKIPGTIIKEVWRNAGRLPTSGARGSFDEIRGGIAEFFCKALTEILGVGEPDHVGYFKHFVFAGFEEFGGFLHS
jgi:hypothetical protein